MAGESGGTENNLGRGKTQMLVLNQIFQEYKNSTSSFKEPQGVFCSQGLHSGVDWYFLAALLLGYQMSTHSSGEQVVGKIMGFFLIAVIYSSKAYFSQMKPTEEDKKWTSDAGFQVFRSPGNLNVLSEVGILDLWYHSLLK